MIYIITFIFIALISLIKKKKIFKVLFIIFMSFFFGFRDKVGPDWTPYVNYFKNYNINKETIEIGYKYLNIFYNKFFNFNFLIFSIFLFSILIFLKVSQDYTDNYKIATFAWLSYNFINFGILRQIIAIYIFWYSIRYIQNRDFKKYSLCIILASLFHASAWVLFPFYWIAIIKIKFRNLILIILFGLLFLKFNLIIKIISLLHFIPYIGRKLIFYIGTRFSNFRFDIRIIENIILIILANLLDKRIKTNYKYALIFKNFVIYNLLIGIYFANFMLFSSRYIKYFELGNIMLVSYILKVIFIKKNNKIIINSLAILYLFYRYMYIINSKPYYLPYENYIMNLFK